MLTPASAHDRLTTTTIAVSPHTTGNQTKRQILDKRFIPVSRKAKEMSPMIATAYCLGRVFRPLPRVGNQVRVCSSHRVEEAQIKVGEEQRRLASARCITRKEGAKWEGNCGDLQSSSQMFGRILSSAQASEETTNIG